MRENTILITGGTGYLGSRVIAELLLHGWSIYAYVRNKAQLKQLQPFSEEITIIGPDDSLDIKVNIILHAATCYGRHGENIEEIYQSNVIMPLKLITSNNNASDITFINIDTVLDKETNEYSLSKKHFLEALLLYRNRVKSIINIKLDHFYGPNESTNKFIASMISLCLANQNKIALTQGEQQRNFLFIDDVVDAILTMINYSASNDISVFEEFSVCADENIAIKDLVILIHTLTNSSSCLDFGVLKYRTNELMYSPINNGRIKSIGWTPKTGLFQGISKCIQAKDG